MKTERLYGHMTHAQVCGILRDVVMSFQPLAELYREEAKERATALGLKKCELFLVTERRIHIYRQDVLRLVKTLSAILFNVNRPRLEAWRVEFDEPVASEVNRLRAEDAAYRRAEKQADESEWFENSFEYSVECARAEHEGDVRPNPADYGLDPADYRTVDKPPGGEE